MPAYEKEKIFVIDDDMTVTTTIDYLLNRKYVIDVAFSGRNGLEFLKGKETYPVILLDIELKDMSGVDVLKKMKSLKIPSEVIMLTANQDVGVAVETMKAGAFDYIQKPFTFEILDSCITRALDSYRKKIRVVTREMIVEALKMHKGRQYDAARYLKIDVDALLRKIAEFGICLEEIG